MPVVLCIICHLCIITAHVMLLNYYNINVMNYWANLVLPIGAFMLGLTASGAFVAACRFADYPATLAIRKVMFLSAALMFPLTYAAEYGFAHTGDAYVRSVMTFGEYAMLKLEHAQFSLRAHPDSITNLGSVGYVMALIEWAAYTASAFFAYRILYRYPFCEPCSRFYKSITKRHIQFRNEEDFARFYRELPHSKVTRTDMAKSFVSGFRPMTSTKKGSWQFTFAHSHCPVCKLENVRESVNVMGNRQRHEVAELKREYSIERNAAVQSGQPRRAQFGRRSI